MGRYCAPTRAGVYGGDPYGRAEAADVHDALRAQTMWAAHELFLDDKIGSIEVGKYADIAVWDKNPYEASVDAIKTLACQLTLFQGQIVYRAPATTLEIEGPTSPPAQ